MPQRVLLPRVRLLVLLVMMLQQVRPAVPSWSATVRLVLLPVVLLRERCQRFEPVVV